MLEHRHKSPPSSTSPFEAPPSAYLTRLELIVSTLRMILISLHRMLRTSRANKITIVSIRTPINLLLINILLRILSLSSSLSTPLLRSH